jgi:hypothetical protein
VTDTPGGLDLQLDPDKATFVTVLGAKGEGKSVFARWLWDSYPYDRLALDPTGDVWRALKADERDDTKLLEEPMPAKFPTGTTGERASWLFKPDPASATFGDDLDRAAGLAFFNRKTMLWVDEVNELTSAHKTSPHYRRILYQGRHRDLTLVQCGPRARDIHPLVISQADLVVVFRMPHPYDVDMVAGNIGWKPKELGELIDELPRHGFALYDSRERMMNVCPPLPPRKTRRTPQATLDADPAL